MFYNNNIQMEREKKMPKETLKNFKKNKRRRKDKNVKEQKAE